MLIELKNIQKTYISGSGVTFRALADISATFDGTGLVYLVGASGSGKSTLLNVIGGLDGYDSGELILAGRRMNGLKAAEIDSLRNTLMGFVFQEFNLIDTLNVYDNVKLALDMQSHKGDKAVWDALEEMGIADKAKNKAKDLSGGQRQRVAIARALVKNPRIILADEPTGSLDASTSGEVISILKELSKTRLVIVVTHDMDAAVKTGDRIIEMKDGRIYRDVRRKEEGEEIAVTETEIYSDTLMTVPAGASVTEGDAERLNGILSRSLRKTYVNVESDPRKVKALFPNLREAVNAAQTDNKQRKTENSGESSLSDVFVPYKGADRTKETVEFKRSRLSPLTMCKLALNNMNYKKVRMVITVIISFLAFIMFGVSQSFVNYDLNAAITKTLEKGDDVSVAVVSGDADFYSESWRGSFISENDISRLKKTYDAIKYTVQYDIVFSIPQQTPAYGNVLDKFEGVVETDDVGGMGLKMLYGSGVCPDYESVVISQYAAQSLIERGVTAAGTAERLIGETVSLNGGYDFRIVGIFECEDMKKLLNYDHNFFGYVGMRMLIIGGWGQLYVKPGFAEKYVSENIDGIAVTAEMTSDMFEHKPPEMSLTAGFELPDKEVYPIVGDGKIVSPNDIIVSTDILNELFFETDFSGLGDAAALAEKLNGDVSRRLALRDKDVGVLSVFDDFRIVGLVDADYEKQSKIWFSQDVKNDAVSAFLRPSLIYADITDCSEKKFVDAVYDNGFIICEPFIDAYDTAVMVMNILHYVLLVLAVVFSLLVTLLLFGFISTSIKFTKKQIGILRALGAKKSDTFMIYAVEGFLISLFALALAFAAIAIGAPILNAALSGAMGFRFALFTVTAPVYLIMAALALVVAVISVLIPIRKFNKITPVSAISGKDK